MSRGKKDREEITNTEEVKETEVSDEMEKAEDSEKAEDDKKPEETKETDDKPVSLYVQEPFIDPSVYRQRRKKRIIRTVTIAVVATLLAVYAPKRCSSICTVLEQTRRSTAEMS